MKNLKTITVLTLLLITCTFSNAQKKITYSGKAYSTIENSMLNEVDTVNEDRINSGYMLLDLGININPNQVTEIKSVFRFKNEFGGFYGVGSSVQYRELYVRGIIADAVKYQFGDIKIKQTPYTLFNNNEASDVNEATVFTMMREISEYENLNIGNKWWQQGGQAETHFLFDKGIEKLDINGFITRNRSTNWSSVPEILHGGGSITVEQGKFLTVSGNYINLFSLTETANTTKGFNNAVTTMSYKLYHEVDSMKFFLNGELGTSNITYKNNPDAPSSVSDYFYEAGIGVEMKKTGLKARVGYRNVGPEFISAGAQSLRVNYGANPQHFPLVANDTVNLRQISMADLINDQTVYNPLITEQLMDYDYRLSNAMPYGVATPNRSGIIACVEYDTDNIEAKVEYAGLSEIQKYGTTELRKFMVAKATANIHVNKFLGWNNAIIFNIGEKFETTSREGDTLQTIDLTSTLTNIGLEVEIFKNFDVITGVKLLSAKGNEVMAVKNKYNEIVSYQNVELDESETLIGVGLRYRFNENIYLALHGYQFTFSENLAKLSNYDTKQLYITFNMKF